MTDTQTTTRQAVDEAITLTANRLQIAIATLAAHAETATTTQTRRDLVEDMASLVGLLGELDIMAGSGQIIAQGWNGETRVEAADGRVRTLGLDEESSGPRDTGDPE